MTAEFLPSAHGRMAPSRSTLNGQFYFPCLHIVPRALGAIVDTHSFPSPIKGGLGSVMHVGD
jgi:hypothetical protein